MSPGDPSPPTSATDLRAKYQDLHRSFQQKVDEYEGKSRRLENLRGISFAAAIIGCGYFLAQGSRVGGAIGLGSLLIFLALVAHHGRVLEKVAHQKRFSIVNEHAELRLRGDFRGLPRTGATFAPKEHLSAEDLDLFGVGSLYQRVSVAHTRYGQTTLAAWLSAPAAREEILARQKAVVELAAQLSFRQELEAEGMALVEKKRGRSTQITDGPNPVRLLSWIAEEGQLRKSVLLLALSFLLPVLTLSGIFAQVFLRTPPTFWLGPMLLGLVLLSLNKKACSDAFAAVSTTEGAFLRYGRLLEILEAYDAKAPWLKERRERLLARQGQKPSEVMRRFRRLVSWFDLRHNGMVYPVVNALLLWDIHMTRALENWKKDAGQDLDRWFTVIGDFEAISSLAGAYADDPGASIPEIIVDGEGPAGITAVALGHPLLPTGKRITNDLELLSVGHALLITGSNMSGKSTFLRSLGTNVVLALAGGAVAAKSMTLPRCLLGTSIRVSDSLGSGVSHFYAEVQKLAQIVSLACAGQLPVLFLLDEVLHGTNSRERQVGARWVLAELLKMGAFGIVTTHDMELCRLPEPLMQLVRQHHFREGEKDGEMTFDYTLREGPVTSGNALRLMHRVGLKVPLES